MYSLYNQRDFCWRWQGRISFWMCTAYPLSCIICITFKPLMIPRLFDFVCIPFGNVGLRDLTRSFDFDGFFHNHQKSRCKEIHSMHLQGEPLSSRCRPHRCGLLQWTFHKVSIKHHWRNRILWGISLFSRYLIPCLEFPGEGPDLTFATINLSSCQGNLCSAVSLGESSDSLSLVCAQDT